MRKFDPEADFIVVRSKKTGKHEHVTLSELDHIFEGIGQSAGGVAPEALSELAAVNAKALSEVVQMLDALNRRITVLEDGIVALSEDARRKLMESAA